MLLKKETIQSVLKRTLSAFLIVVFIFFPLQKTEAAAQWVNLEINPTYVDGDLTDFPVYVDLSDLPTAFWTTTNCTDIRVFKSDGTTEVPREIVSCTDSGSTGTGELWFLADGTLSSTATTTFQIHYDGTSSDYAVTATYGRNNVWTDYSYVGHDGGGTDSSGNLSLSAQGSPVAGDSVGKVGSSTQYNGTNEGYYATISAPSVPVTHSAWFYTTNTNASQEMVGYGSNTSNTPFYIMNIDTTIANNPVYVNYRDNTKTIGFTSTTGASENNWHYGVARYISSTSRKISVDDNATVENTTTVGVPSVNNFSIAHLRRPSLAIYFGGYIDEVRDRVGSVSDDWIAAEYDNQNTPTPFYWVSGEQTAAGGGVIRQSIFWF